MRKRLLLLILTFIAGFFCDKGAFGAISLDSTFAVPSGYKQFMPSTATMADGYDSALQADGKIVVVGNATIAGAVEGVVARLNADGTLDGTFDGDGYAIVNNGSQTAYDERIFAVAIQTDGKIVAWGQQTSSSGGRIVRFNTNGTPDSTFGTGGGANFGIWGSGAVAIQTDGKIVLSGIGGAGNDFYLLRLNANGTLDSTFDGDGIFTLPNANMHRGLSIAIQADGKIVVAGEGGGQAKIIRVTTSGALDTTFATAGYYTRASEFMFASAAIQTDGKIVAVIDGSGTVIRLNADGSPDNSFGTSGIASASNMFLKDLAIQADGKIVVAGYSIGTSSAAIKRLNANGSEDAAGAYSFPITSTEGKSVLLQTDGKIVVAGLMSAQMLAFRLTVPADLPVISASPTSHNFGNVNVGSTSTAQTFTITNTGTANLVIGIITLTGTDAAEFSKPADTCTVTTIAPAGTCTIQATLTPATAAAKTANISIPSNDPNTATLTIALSGTGVQQYTLTVTKSGTGTGTVSATGCTLSWTGSTGTCTANAGAGNTLAGTADTGSTFAGWSGGTGSASACTGTGQCIFNITATSGVTATFNAQAQTYTITATANPTAGGSVSCNPNPVSQGATSTCTVTTNAGYTLSGVTGTCGGALVGSTYTTNAITANCTVTANYTQQQQQCTYGLNPTTQNYAIAGGTGSVSVTAGTGCAWTAASSAAWTTVTSGATGTGNGTVNYSVAANTGALRTGAITIAGQTFTVTQDGATQQTGTLVVMPASLDFGPITAGQQSPSQSVTALITGSGPVAITTVSLAGADFLKTSDTCTGKTLQAGEYCGISVAFKPATTGSKAGTLTVNNKTVSLTGAGAAVAISNHDYDDSEASYGANCYQVTDARAFNGSFKRCANYGGIGGTVTLNFTGHYISVMGSLSRYGGKAAVYIDNYYAGVIDTYSADDLFQQSIFSATTLQGTHTLKITPLSSILGRGITIDGFVVKSR